VEKPPLAELSQGIGVRQGSRPSPSPGSFFSQGS